MPARTIPSSVASPVATAQDPGQRPAWATGRPVVQTVLGAALVLVTICSLAPAHATTYRVGIGADCTHSNLQAALNAAVADANGPHTIRMVSGTSEAPNLAISDPLADITIIGGHQSCLDNAPTGSATNVLRNSASSPQGNRILRIGNAVGNPRRTVRLERIIIEGGRNPSTDLFLGGGLLAIGRVTVELGPRTEIRDNEARNGGGVALFNLNSNPDLATVLVIDGHAAIQNNRANGTGSNGNGGGVYALGGSRVQLTNARVGFNTATRAGGGLYLGGANDSLLLNPTAPTHEVSIFNNTAGSDGNDDTRGFGGGIYLDQGTISYVGPGTPTGRYSLGLFNNVANFGGALYAQGPAGLSASYSVLELRNVALSLNEARRVGGAIYLNNAVELRIRRWGQGSCVNFGDPQRPCVSLRDNRSANTGGSTSFGAGPVAFLTNAASALGPRLRISGALIMDNIDDNGTTAVIDARSASTVEITRSILLDNAAMGASTFRSLIETNNDLRLNYNTVLARPEEVRQLLLLPTNRIARATGSILYAPGVDLVDQPAERRIQHEGCLISHTLEGLNVTELGNVQVREPGLDSNFVPRGGSPALDNCDLVQDVTLLWTGQDALGADVVNNASVPNFPYGPHDLGAIERVDLLFYGGFGTRPLN